MKKLPHVQGNYWQIKTDEDTGDGWASLQVIQKTRDKLQVLAWVMLRPEHLRAVAAAASEIADAIDAKTAGASQ